MTSSLALLLIFGWAQGRQSLITPDSADQKSNSRLDERPKTKPQVTSSNLPEIFRNRRFRKISEESRIVLPVTRSGVRFSGLKPGDILDAEIRESAFAFPDSKAPVRAVVSSGVLKDSLLLGEATLEKNSKRILISFNRFRKANDPLVFNLAASALDSKGIQGLVGEYQSSESKLFAAEFLAAGAAGYADSTVDRSQNLIGNSIEQPSASNFAKKALASAFSKTSGSISEKLKNAPEFSILEGPVQIKILITDEVRIN